MRDRAAAARVRRRSGKVRRIDVVVNNAARGLSAAVEEATEREVRDLIDTNLLGTLWVTQAALPIMRARGTVVQISSGGGVISWPTNGLYQATKFGVDGLSEASPETRHLGIKVTIVQVGHMDPISAGR